MFRIAIKKAEESKFERARMGAVIVKGGNILSTGTNEIRGYSGFKHKHPRSLHAEASAIKYLLDRKRLHSLAGSVLYVTRVTTKGRSALAKPCEHCMELIKAVGIKKVIYTTNSGIEEIKM